MSSLCHTDIVRLREQEKDLHSDTHRDRMLGNQKINAGIYLKRSNITY